MRGHLVNHELERTQKEGDVIIRDTTSLFTWSDWVIREKFSHNSWCQPKPA